MIANSSLISPIMQFSPLQIDDFLFENLKIEISVICIKEGRRFDCFASFRPTLITVFFTINRSFGDLPSLGIYHCSQINGNFIDKIFVSRLGDECG
jgi:hypothetical protein